MASKQAEKLVVKARLCVVKLDDIQVDASYQRDVKAKHKRIVDDFREEALGIPLVGERTDGSLYIVDGFQRITALRKLGKCEVRAEVFASRGSEHEAEVFKLVNINRTKLTPAEEFRALLTSHDPVAWEIKEAVEASGLKLNLKGGGDKTGVACVTTLRQCHKLYGVDAIRFALSTANAAWPDDRLGLYNQMVGGLAYFFNSHDGFVDLERLLPRLRTVTPHKVMYVAKQQAIGGGSNSSITAVGASLERIYRKRLNTKLGS